MEQKLCSSCNTLKDITEFSWKNKLKGTRQHICKDCYNIKNRAYYEQHKTEMIPAIYESKKKRINLIREWVRNYKSSHPCTCGETRWWVMDFHHKNGDLKDSIISEMISNNSLEKIKEEIDKCAVLCSNCHRHLHYLERLKVDEE